MEKRSRKFNRNLLTGALLGGGFLLAFLFTTQTAAAQSIPPGSYQQSCGHIEFVGTTLKAHCRGKYWGSNMSMDELNKTPPNTELQDAHLCGEISNNDSKLVCHNNLGSKACQAAKAAFTEASTNIFGQTESNEIVLKAWIFLTLFKYGAAKAYFAEMDPFDAEKVLIKEIAEGQAAKIRRNIIERTFYHATGGEATATDLAFWEAKIQQQQAWYKVILSAAKQEMNKKPSGRKLMIQTGYVTAFGRMPTDGDLSYWQPRGESFKDIVEANRNWLYSPNGAKDLSEMATLILKIDLKRTPSEAEIKNTISEYGKKRSIFMEIRGVMPPIYY